MDMRKRRDAQLAYISDESVFEEQVVCRRILQKLNFMDRADFDGIAEVVKELLGKSDNAFINPPFYCFTATMEKILRLVRIFLQIITVRFWMWQR